MFPRPYSLRDHIRNAIPSAILCQVVRPGRIASRSHTPGAFMAIGYQELIIRRPYSLDPVRDRYHHTRRSSVMNGIERIKAWVQKERFSDEAVACASNISQASSDLKIEVPPVILRSLSIVLSFIHSFSLSFSIFRFSKLCLQSILSIPALLQLNNEVLALCRRCCGFRLQCQRR
jgi:hypothetical protein